MRSSFFIVKIECSFAFEGGGMLYLDIQNLNKNEKKFY